MSNVSEIMLRRFGVLYGEPRTSDMEAFVAEYEKALKGTATDLLEAATDKIVKSQERRSWPTPGECCKAVHAVAEKHYAWTNVATVTEPEPQRQPLTPEERERSRKLMDQFRKDMASHYVSDLSQKAPAVDRDAWNSRRLVGVTRFGDPIRKPNESGG